jgi:hypothetical protein
VAVTVCVCVRVRGGVVAGARTAEWPTPLLPPAPPTHARPGPGPGPGLRAKQVARPLAGLGGGGSGHRNISCGRARRGTRWSSLGKAAARVVSWWSMVSPSPPGPTPREQHATCWQLRHPASIGSHASLSFSASLARSPLMDAILQAEAAAHELWTD